MGWDLPTARTGRLRRWVRLAALPTGATADTVLVVSILGPVAVGCVVVVVARLLGGVPVLGPVLVTAVATASTTALAAVVGAGARAARRARRDGVPLGARRRWLAERLRADLLAAGRPVTPACAEADALARRVCRPPLRPADPATLAEADHLRCEVRRLELAGLVLQDSPVTAAAVHERDEVLGRLRALAAEVDTESDRRIRAALDARAEIRALERT